jgi:hypothetical protein
MTNGERFAALWKSAEAEGVQYICYRGGILPGEENIEGMFHPDPWKNGTGPQIWLYRIPCPSPNDAPVLDGAFVLSDLIVFAHEYGHMRSWKDAADGTTPEWRAYFEAAGVRDADATKLSAAQAQLIMTEEGRAWDIGHEALRLLGFEDWTEFERRREIGLQGHRTTMGL